MLKPKLIIRVQTAEEEMGYLWYVLNSVPFYTSTDITIKFQLILKT
ncbi:hypothetical protein GW755_02450 [bacterium]|nr:hypothetical protein [bacterium]